MHKYQDGGPGGQDRMALQNTEVRYLEFLKNRREPLLFSGLTAH
jgi:hypothetical protein